MSMSTLKHRHIYKIFGDLVLEMKGKEFKEEFDWLKLPLGISAFPGSCCPA